MLKGVFHLFLLGLTVPAYTQHLAAYQIFTAGGRKISFDKMSHQLAKKDIILFGELHDNPIDHWLQLKLVKELHQSRRLILGAEMFESNEQEALDSYMRGDIDQLQEFPSLSLWPNFQTDYAPLVEFAKEEEISFIATNVPSVLAKSVYLSGFQALDTLTASQRGFLAPLPIPFDSDLKTYKAIKDLMPDHATPELIMAQALRDATMAHFILTNYRRTHQFLHINGTYHSENYEGILWYLQMQRKDLDYATIATVEQTSVRKLLPEYRKIADYIICVDEEMTQTH